MPLFDNTPFASLNGTLLVAGQPSYGWGNLNTQQAPCEFLVTNGVSLGGTATLTGTVVAGNTPAVGDRLSTKVDNASFAVSNVVITAVSITAATGQGTISYANASNVASVAVTGFARIPVAETSETMVNGASVAFCFQYNDPNMSNARSIRAVVNLPTLPSTGKVTLQSAINRVDSEFVDVVTIATVAGGAQVGSQSVVTLEPGRWYRFNSSLVSNVVAVVPKIIAKMMV